MKPYGYINGKIVTGDKMFVSTYDIGILRGYGIYEGITTHNNKAFYLKAHLKRFRSAAKRLNIKIPHSDEQITNIIKSLIKKNGFERTNLRMILTGGETIQGIEFEKNKPTFYILAEEWKPIPPEFYTHGAKIITEEYQRFMPEIKTTNYINAVRLQKKRKTSKSIEILLVSGGQALECSTSNIFMFKENKLITTDKNILPGITRKAVMDVARKNFKIEERKISLDELLKADEVFITSSYKDIVPIVKIDKNTIGKGRVGENTKKLMSLFSELIKNN